MRSLPLLAAISCLLFSCQKSYNWKDYAPVQSFGGYTSSSEIAPSNLVAHFSFENSLVDSVSGTAADNFGTSFTPGIKGTAMQGALNSYALFTPTSGINGLQSMTVSYWVNTPMNPNGIMDPVCFVNSGQFWSNLDMFFDGQTDNSAVFKVHMYGNGGASEEWLPNWNLSNPWNTWLNIAVTYDQASSTFALYVNGVQAESATSPGFGPLNFQNFPKIVLGTVQFQTDPSLTTATGSQPWGSYLLGALDEVRIYNTALGASDLRALYQLENLGR
jgi:hypothetical protein